MKKIVLSISIILSVLLSLAPTAGAEYDTEIQRYIVILEEPALYSADRPMLFSANEEYKNEVRRALLELQADIKAQISPAAQLYGADSAFDGEYSYTDVLNGFTVTVDCETAEAISKLDGVKEVFADGIIATISDDASESAEEAESGSETVEAVSAANSGNLINTSYAYENGYTGEGRTVAILDSTLYYDNSYFTLSDTSTVKYTEDSLAQVFSEKGIELDAGSAYKTAKVPFAYDYASNSYTLNENALQHGTHVSGIAAGYKSALGDGIMRGVAPEAQILFFGVSSSNGSISFSVAAKALNDAVMLGADAINMSFGDDYASENAIGKIYTTFRNAVENAENAGCFVSVSGGNVNRGNVTNPENYDYSASDNNLFPNAASVGSVHNNYRVARMLTDENGNNYASGVKSGVYELALTELVDCGGGTSEEIAQLTLTDKVAVIQKPDSILADTDSAYYSRAKSAGAAALILIESTEQVKDTIFSSTYTIPFYLMAKSEGERLLSDASQIKCERRLMIAQNSDSPRASRFSSYGFSDSLDISIDFSAPGGNIYSAYLDGYMPMSGTSMASPHVAGAGVLMSQYVDENYSGYTDGAKVSLIKNLLASTAQNVYEDNGALASVRKVGSGIIQLDKAMQTRIILHDGNGKSRVTLGDNIGKNFNVSFYAENISDTAVTFDAAEVEISSDDFKYYDKLEEYAYYGIKKLNATYSFENAVTVAPYSKEKITLNVTLNDDELGYLSAVMTNGFFIDGKVTLSATDESNVDVGIPFTGFYGDWAEITVLDESDINSNLELYSDIGDCELYCNLEGVTGSYSMPFTTEPDTTVAESPLSLSMKIRRNTYAKIIVDGEVVSSVFIEKNTKATMLKFLKTNSILSDKLKDGSVEIKISYTLPLHNGEEADQTILITPAAQNEKPVINSIGVTEAGGVRSAELSASGNLISTVLRKGHKTNGDEVIGAKTIREAQATIADNVSSLSDASFYVYDSAFNMTAVEHDISIEVTDNTAIFKNTTINDISGVCLIAVYDDTGKMEKVSFLCENDKVFTAYENLEVDISEYAGKKYKLFFWKSTASLVPYCNAY